MPPKMPFTGFAQIDGLFTYIYYIYYRHESLKSPEFRFLGIVAIKLKM